MKCPVCKYDEALPFIQLKEKVVDTKGRTHTVLICPACATLQADFRKARDIRLNKFEGCQCPWCGNTGEEAFSIVSRVDTIAMNDIRTFNAGCSCGGRGPDAESEEEAIAKFGRIPF